MSGLYLYTEPTRQRRGASLASSSETEKGGNSPPPRKRRRLPISCLDTTTSTNSTNSTLPGHSQSTNASISASATGEMHQANGAHIQNGSATSHTNGTYGSEKKMERPSFTPQQKDFVRLIGQYLLNLGLE